MAIVADTKDWTWILERACPECGFDSTTVSGPAVPGLVARVTAAWQQVLGGPKVRVRPVRDRWSPLEYGCHVRDVLRLCDARLQLMLIQHDPTFPDWDQDRTAAEAGYAGQDPTAVAESIAAAGARLASDLGTLDPGDWRRTGRRSDGAGFSVETFARYVAHDPVHHLADVGVHL